MGERNEGCIVWFVLLFSIVAWGVLPLWDGICGCFSDGECLFVGFTQVENGNFFERFVCEGVLFVLFVSAASLVFCLSNVMSRVFCVGK